LLLALPLLLLLLGPVLLLQPMHIYCLWLPLFLVWLVDPLLLSPLLLVLLLFPQPALLL
jgi:hypothetical protein